MTVGKERPLVWRHCVYCINFIPFASTPSVKWNCVVQCSLQKFHFSSHTATSCTICFGKKVDRSGREKFGARARMNSAKNLLSMRAHGSAQQINMQNMSHLIFIFCCSLILLDSCMQGCLELVVWDFLWGWLRQHRQIGYTCYPNLLNVHALLEPV